MTSPQNTSTVYLIDASIYIFQSHFSPYVDSASSRGEDLSALYGFTQFLLQFLRRVKPTHVGVAQDESLFLGFRHQLCPNYKSNRELPDENLAMQLLGCAEMCGLLGLKSYGSKVFEGDDIIGTMAAGVRRQPTPCAVEIVSRDKDLAQLLVGEKDCLWDYSGSRKRYSDNILEDFGVRPEQIPDYLGLIGDSVDCISGVPGVGPVKARELLKHYHSMEGVYLNLDKIADLPLRGASKLAALLSEHRELADLSKLLATIVCEHEASAQAEDFTSVGFETLERGKLDLPGLEEFVFEYGFKSADADFILSQASRLGSA